MPEDTDQNARLQSEQASPPSPPRVAGDSISVGVGDAAKNVAAGKNIIQIGSLSIPMWLALFIIAVLALVAVLVGAVAYFSQQTGASTQQAAAILAYTPTPSPTATPVPTVTPTALPFAPAAEGETMIVILPFHSTAANDSEPHKKIWRRIQEFLQQKMPNGPVTAVIDPNTVLTADQQAEAEIVGKRYNASMVIWGEDTGVELIASFLNLREPDLAAADVDISETQRTQLANPGQYAEFVTRELPGQLAFLSLFAVGQTYYLAGNYPPAIDTIESAVAEVSSANDQDTGDQAAAISEGLTEAYFRLGWLYQQEPADLNAALADYDRAIALDPQHVPAYVNRGAAYSDKGDLDQAIANFTQAIALNPQDTDAFYNRALTYYAKRDFDHSIADSTQVITLDPQAADAYVNRGLAYSDKGDLDQAIADYDQAIALDPQLPRAYINRGNAYYSKGDLDQAIADYTKAISLNPQYAFAYYNRGNAHYAKADLDQAIADYSKAITLNPQDADVYVNRGIAYAKKGDLDQAIADYSKAITLNPQDADVYVKRGVAYAKKGDLDQAIADYDQAVALDPRLASAYNDRGHAYSDKGDLDQAIVDFTQSIALDPHLASAYNDRGHAYYVKGELDQAIADYDQAIILDPEDALAYYNRGHAYSDKGDLDQAIVDFTQAVALDPQDADTYNLLCWSFALQQKPTQAMTYCEKAVALADDPNYFDSRGLAHALLGDFPAAIADFQVFVDWLAVNYPDETQLMEQRRDWVESLRRGENPFTPDVLEELIKQ